MTRDVDATFLRLPGGKGREGGGRGGGEEVEREVEVEEESEEGDGGRRGGSPER